MVDSYMATGIIVAFLITFGILIPILDRIPKVKDFISLRWLLVVTYSAMCLGVIINFEHLDTSVRFAVVVGGIVLSSLFLLVRSLEKAAINRWKIPHLKTRVQKGELSGEFSVFSDEEDSQGNQK